MNENEQHDHFSDLVTAHAFDPDMQAPDDVSPEQWVEIGRLAALESAMFAHFHGAPPLQQDPVAAMLGLVPDPHLALDGTALARARKNAKLKVSDLARALTRRGWDVAASDVARWESRSEANMPPALIEAIATEIGTVPDRITTDRSPHDAAIDEAARTPAFESLVRRFAALQGLSQAVATSTLRSRALATQHRGGPPEPSRWLQTLEAFVSALENRDSSEPPNDSRSH